MRIETHNLDAEFYIASLALGILYGMKQGVVHPEVGIWSLGRPAFSTQVNKAKELSNLLKKVIYVFDEIDCWEDNPRQQLRMIDEMIGDCLQCLQQAAARNNPLIAIMSMRSFSEEDIWNKRFWVSCASRNLNRLRLSSVQSFHASYGMEHNDLLVCVYGKWRGRGITKKPKNKGAREWKSKKAISLCYSSICIWSMAKRLVNKMP